MTAPKKIILLVIDTLRADHLGCYGYARNTTPNIDRLATESVVFSHAFTPVSYTLPAIASLLTSKRPKNHGIGLRKEGALSKDADLTLAELLRGKGYATAAFVSTILLRRATNLDSGFDIYDDLLTSSEHNRPDIMLRDGKETIARALEYLGQEKGKELFAFIHLMDVHGPYICPAPHDSLFLDDALRERKTVLRVVPDNHPYAGIPAYQVLKASGAAAGDISGFIDDPRYYCARYDGCIRKSDEIVGGLIHGLKSIGIYDDTLLILTADHGEALGENDIYFFHGVTVTPEQLSVPLLIKPPSNSGWSAKRLDTHVSIMDLMPTLLSLSGIDLEGLDLHGSSLQRLIEEDADPRLQMRTLTSENECQRALIRPDGTMKLQKDSKQFHGYYACVPEVIDRLDGRKYNWKTGKEISAGFSQIKSRIFRHRGLTGDEPVSIQRLARIAYLHGSRVLPSGVKRRIKPIAKEMLSWLEDPIPSVSQPKPYAVQVVEQPATNRPRVLHALANFCIGGSSRLVVDLIERLGDSYEQEVLTSFIPKTPAYVGIKVTQLGNNASTEDFIRHIRLSGPAFLHVHYWGTCDHSWYAKVFHAAERCRRPVIENINTPVVPYFSEAVKRYVYVSNYVDDQFGRRDTNSMVVYPGSNFDLFSPLGDASVADDCIGMVYRLERDKLDEHSIDPFISAAKRRPATKVLIVGDGALLKPFQAAVHGCGVSHQFQFTGYVPYIELPQLYSRMAVFVAPVWQESFGQVTPFAMSMGIPVAGYDVGALSEILGSREFLAPAGDSEALADIIIQLLDDAQRRHTIGRANRERAAAHFSVQAMTDKYRALYEDICRNASAHDTVVATDRT